MVVGETDGVSEGALETLGAFEIVGPADGDSLTASEGASEQKKVCGTKKKLVRESVVLFP